MLVVPFRQGQRPIGAVLEAKGILYPFTHVTRGIHEPMDQSASMILGDLDRPSAGRKGALHVEGARQLTAPAAITGLRIPSDWFHNTSSAPGKESER